MSDTGPHPALVDSWSRVVAWADARKRARLIATAILDGSARGDEAQELARWVVAELGDET